MGWPGPICHMGLVMFWGPYKPIFVPGHWCCMQSSSDPGNHCYPGITVSWLPFQKVENYNNNSLYVSLQTDVILRPIKFPYWCIKFDVITMIFATIVFFPVLFTFFLWSVLQEYWSSGCISLMKKLATFGKNYARNVKFSLVSEAVYVDIIDTSFILEWHKFAS